MSRVAPAACAVSHGRQVGGGVAVPAVGLTHDQRERVALAVLEALGEARERAIVLDQQALGVELVDHDWQQRVVEALPHDVVVGQEHAEKVIDLARVPHGLGYEDPPQAQRLGVAALKQHDAPPAPLGERGIAVELEARRGVELVEVPHAEGLGVLCAADVDQVLEEHAEWRPPVADVVLPPHVVPEEPEHTRQRVADDGGAEMPDVHLLGHVGRGVVDDYPLGTFRRRHAQPGIARECCHPPGNELVRQRQVDEARPTDLDLRADVAQGGRRRHLFGHLERRATHLLGQGKGAVRLVVGAVGCPQHGVRPRQHRVEGGLQALQEDAGSVGHPSFSHARRGAEPGPGGGQSAGAPMAPSSNP